VKLTEVILEKGHTLRIPGNRFVAVFVFASVAIAVAFSSLLFLNWTRLGFDVTPDQANESLHQPFQIPPGATDVRFVSNPRYTKVCFKVNPSSFDTWSRTMKFQTRAITIDKPESSFRIVSREKVDSLTTTAGIHFSSPNPCGISGVFDSERELCSAIFECE
jgi:hypothetical protein